MGKLLIRPESLVAHQRGWPTKERKEEEEEEEEEKEEEKEA